MPYEVVRFPDGYRVMTTTTGAFHSNHSLPLETAKAQQRALYASGSAMPPQYTANLTRQQKAQQTALINKSKRDYERTGMVVDRPKVSTSPTKRSPHAIRFENKYGFPITDKARVKATFPDTDVDAILSKGVGAYGSSGSRPNVGQSQWAYARLASVLTGGPSLRIDKDLVGDKSLQTIKGSGRDKFLMTANRKARDAGLIGKVSYANDGVHKLKITAPDGSIRRFGAEGYGDHIYWSQEEAEGRVPKGYADNKRRLYRARATKIKGDWSKDPYSPNSLAIAILW